MVIGLIIIYDFKGMGLQGTFYIMSLCNVSIFITSMVCFYILIISQGKAIQIKYFILTILNYL